MMMMMMMMMIKGPTLKVMEGKRERKRKRGEEIKLEAPLLVSSCTLTLHVRYTCTGLRRCRPPDR